MEIEITNGQGIINILFDDFASCLVICKPLAGSWPDCRGSVGEYYAISDYSTIEREQYTNDLNDYLINGNDENQIKCISRFLNLFANGIYKVGKSIIEVNQFSFLTNNQVFYSKQVPENEKFSGAFYPFYDDNAEPHIYSITNKYLNKERIEFYIELIKKGIKPTIIVFEVYNVESCEYSRSYVLDGHHKIEAYLKLKQPIPAIFIQKSIIKKDDSLNLLKEIKPILKDFEYEHIFKHNDGINKT